MLDKIDRKLLCLLQQDCTLSLQALADAVNLTTTPCWKRLKRLEDDGILLGRVALLDPEKLGLGLTAFVLIKTQHHSSEWYCRFVTVVSEMPEVLGFWRMAGEYDYLMRVQVADMSGMTTSINVWSIASQDCQTSPPVLRWNRLSTPPLCPLNNSPGIAGNHIRK